MHFTAGDCPVGCGDVAFVTPLGGGPVLLYCDGCMCVWPDSAALDGVGDYKQLSDFGATESGLRAATRPEIEAADLWPWVVKRRETDLGRWGPRTTPTQARSTPALVRVYVRRPEGLDPSWDKGGE